MSMNTSFTYNQTICHFRIAMLRSTSRDGLQSVGDRGFALPGALRWCFRHVFAAGTQEHGRKLIQRIGWTRGKY